MSMSANRATRPRRTTRKAEETRARIVGAVRDLLVEGSYHESTVEEVADRAGVSRATLYQHFASRLDLVDALCDTLSLHPALLAIRAAVRSDDAASAVDRVLANSTTFWSSEDAVFAAIYGVAEVEPGARAFVTRQRDDRHGEVVRLAASLHRAGLLRAGVSQRRAEALLMVLTSYETYRELRAAGQSDREVSRTLRESAATLLLG
jgi:AcrR family transcriptional regulator